MWFKCILSSYCINSKIARNISRTLRTPRCVCSIHWSYIATNRFWSNPIECVVGRERQSTSEYFTERLWSAATFSTRTRGHTFSPTENIEEKYSTISDISSTSNDCSLGGKYLDNISSEFHQSLLIKCLMAMLWFTWNERLASFVSKTRWTKISVSSNHVNIWFEYLSTW